MPELAIVLEPGVGFGSGGHETTQLCLQAIYALYPRERQGWRLLDFGSGSGILSIAAAKLGAEVAGVEIDELAIRDAARNLALNGAQQRVRFARSLDELSGSFELVVANIKLAVLSQFAESLVARLAPGSPLVLSGLVGTDVPSALARYAPLLGGARPEIYERGEWRALVWRGAHSSRAPAASE